MIIVNIKDDNDKCQWISWWLAKRWERESNYSAFDKERDFFDKQILKNLHFRSFFIFFVCSWRWGGAKLFASALTAAKFRFSGKKRSHHFTWDNSEWKHDFWRKTNLLQKTNGNTTFETNGNTTFQEKLICYKKHSFIQIWCSLQKCNLILPFEIALKPSHIFEETSSVMVKILIFSQYWSSTQLTANERFCCICGEV